jgi:hypothetical protein
MGDCIDQLQCLVQQHNEEHKLGDGFIYKCLKVTHRSGYMSSITRWSFSSKPEIRELRFKVLIQKNIRGFKISINNLYNCGRKRLKFYSWKEAAFKCTKTFNVKPRKLRSFINKIRYTMPACTIHSFSKSQKKKNIPLGKEVTINWMQKMSSAKVLSMAVFHNNIPWCKIRQWCDLSSMQWEVWTVDSEMPFGSYGAFFTSQSNPLPEKNEDSGQVISSSRAGDLSIRSEKGNNVLTWSNDLSKPGAQILDDSTSLMAQKGSFYLILIWYDFEFKTLTWNFLL